MTKAMGGAGEESCSLYTSVSSVSIITQYILLWNSRWLKFSDERQIPTWSSIPAIPNGKLLIYFEKNYLVTELFFLMFY